VYGNTNNAKYACILYAYLVLVEASCQREAQVRRRRQHFDGLTQAKECMQAFALAQDRCAGWTPRRAATRTSLSSEQPNALQLHPRVVSSQISGFGNLLKVVMGIQSSSRVNPNSLTHRSS
jgi:hypothetical protein